MNRYYDCTLCPRQCHIDRSKHAGYCGANNQATLAFSWLHMWEEPCLSGHSGSGAVFFSGCSLHCVYCQNEQISHGQQISSDRKHEDQILDSHQLAENYLTLQEQGANNINLITASHYLPHVIESVTLAKKQGLTIPIVYNCGGYETVESINALEGIVDIYLPDFKYMDIDLARKYSKAADYPQVAKAALKEMVNQQPQLIFEGMDEDIPLLKQGVIVRHLLLPDALYQSRKTLEYLHKTYENKILISIMSQYTPVYTGNEYPELKKCISRESYANLIAYAEKLGFENAFIQDGQVASESFIPDF